MGSPDTERRPTRLEKGVGKGSGRGGYMETKATTNKRDTKV
jgi:hypothetical protein